MWNITNGSSRAALEDYMVPISSATFSPDGAVVAFDANNRVRLWDVRKGTLLQSLEGYTEELESIAYSSDGTQIAATADESKQVFLWTITEVNGNPLPSLKLSVPAPVSAIAYSPDGQFLATGTVTGEIYLWESEGGDMVQQFKESGTPIRSIAFSPEGLLAAGARDGSIGVWNVKDSKLVKALTDYKTQITSLAFTSDGQSLAASDIVGNIRLWQSADWSERDFIDNSSPVWDIVFSRPTSELLASVGHDGTVQLWSTKEGKLLSTLHGHTQGAQSVSFNPDGTLLLSSGDDGTVRLWGVFGP